MASSVDHLLQPTSGLSDVGVAHLRTKTTSEIGPTNHSPEGRRNFGILLHCTVPMQLRDQRTEVQGSGTCATQNGKNV